MRGVRCICAVLCLSACVESQQRAFVVQETVQDADLQTVYFVKSGESAQPDEPFLAGRVPGMAFGKAVVSIPAVRQPGEVLYPDSEPPDPNRHFVFTELSQFPSEASFHATLPISASGERVLFVHGYNVNTAEALYSAAQIREDFALEEPMIAFAWPSAGQAQGYLHDRDSVLFARSDLARTLALLTQNANKRVSIVAHSMGAALTMEALRELAIRGDRQTLERIAPVVLVAPDIAPEVFRRQAREIGALPQPFVVFVASNDRALRLSSIVSFQNRLGSIQSPDDIGELKVTVLDLTEFAEGRGLNHEIELNSPAAIRLLSDARQGAPNARRALEQYLVTESLPVFPE